MVIVTGAMCWSGCVESARIRALGDIAVPLLTVPASPHTSLLSVRKGRNSAIRRIENAATAFWFLTTRRWTIKTRRSFFTPYRATPDMVPGESGHWQAPSRTPPRFKAVTLIQRLRPSLCPQQLRTRLPVDATPGADSWSSTA